MFGDLSVSGLSGAVPDLFLRSVRVAAGRAVRGHRRPERLAARGAWATQGRELMMDDRIVLFDAKTSHFLMPFNERSESLLHRSFGSECLPKEPTRDDELVGVEHRHLGFAAPTPRVLHVTPRRRTATTAATPTASAKSAGTTLKKRSRSS